jgi:hypothetical protein
VRNKSIGSKKQAVRSPLGTIKGWHSSDATEAPAQTADSWMC